MANPIKAGIEQIVQKLSSLPPDQQQKAFSQLPPDAQKAVASYAQGGKPQDGSSSKGVAEQAKEIGQKAFDTLKSIDGIANDFVRNVPAAYAGTSVLPYMVVNPIAGAALFVLASGGAQIAANTAYKLVTDIPITLYNTVRAVVFHPVDSVKTVFNFVANPMQKIKMIGKLPLSIWNYMTKPRNENKYAKVAAYLTGAGLGLSYVAPGMFAGNGGMVSHTISSVGQGVSTFKEGAGHVLSTIVDSASAAGHVAMNDYHLYIQPSL
jgi:hypothetical protein